MPQWSTNETLLTNNVLRIKVNENFAKDKRRLLIFFSYVPIIKLICEHKNECVLSGVIWIAYASYIFLFTAATRGELIWLLLSDVGNTNETWEFDTNCFLSDNNVFSSCMLLIWW